MSRAAIISTNKSISRFFELELFMLGHTSDTYKNISSVSRDIYDIVIIDAETVKLGESNAFDCTVALVSNQQDELMGENIICLPWPTPIENIRALFTDKLNTVHIQKNTSNIQSTFDVCNLIYVVDQKQCMIEFGNRYIKLSRNEYLLLNTLCMADGNVVSREAIMNILGAKNSNMADVYICNIRKKLEGNGTARVIFTERGSGYRTILRMA